MPLLSELFVDCDTVDWLGVFMDNGFVFTEANATESVTVTKALGYASEEPEVVWLELAFSTTGSLEGVLMDNGFALAEKNATCTDKSAEVTRQSSARMHAHSSSSELSAHQMPAHAYPRSSLLPAGLASAPAVHASSCAALIDVWEGDPSLCCCLPDELRRL